MKTLAQFAVPLIQTPTDLVEGSRSIVARIMPWGVPIVHEGEQIVFDRDSITYDPSRVVPLVVDHGKGASSRIGRLDSISSTPDGLYGTFIISETQLGLEMHELLLDGVIDEVSAGVALALANEYRDATGLRHRAGELDHVSIVGRGAFGKAGARVLAVHAEGELMLCNLKGTPGHVCDAACTPAPAAPAAPPAAPAAPLELAATPLDLSEFAAAERVDKLEKAIAALQVPGAVSEPHQEFADIKDFVLTLGDAQKGDPRARARIEAYALADDTTTTATGVVPDYRSQEVISIIDTERRFVDTLPKDPIGSAGMTAVYPKVTQKPQVGKQATEKTEVASRAMTVTVDSVDLETFAGASDVARQLIERSQPSFVDMLFREYASEYAQQTNADALAVAIAGAGGTAVLADLGASAAATKAAFNAANSALIAGVRRPATHWALGATRWEQMNNLVDSTGRPLLVFPEDGPTNADGQVDQMAGKYRGVTTFLDPDAGANDALLYNAQRSAAVLEQDPIQLQAEVVSLLGFEMGVYGLFATMVKYAAGLYTFTIV